MDTLFVCVRQAQLETQLRWLPAAPPSAALRRRIEAEVRAISWSLSQFQVLLSEASCLASEHPFLLPRLEVSLPIFELGVRFKIRVSDVNRPALDLLDAQGRRVAMIVLI